MITNEWIYAHITKYVDRYVSVYVNYRPKNSRNVRSSKTFMKWWFRLIMNIGPTGAGKRPHFQVMNPIMENTARMIKRGTHRRSEARVSPSQIPYQSHLQITSRQRKGRARYRINTHGFLVHRKRERIPADDDVCDMMEAAAEGIMSLIKHKWQRDRSVRWRGKFTWLFSSHQHTRDAENKSLHLCSFLNKVSFAWLLLRRNAYHHGSVNRRNCIAISLHL